MMGYDDFNLCIFLMIQGRRGENMEGQKVKVTIIKMTDDQDINLGFKSGGREKRRIVQGCHQGKSDMIYKGSERREDNDNNVSNMSLRLQA